MKKVTVSVINDLATDQRVNKVCLSLCKLGFEVLLIGRLQKESLELSPRIYKTKRMSLFFETGILFYTEYQIRLFFLLLFKKSDVLVSNDLDTLLPNFIISKLKKSHLVYDSHEYFTGVPELENNRIKRNIWKSVENFIFPKLKNVYTVNESIAKLYRDEYHVEVKVLRNVPSSLIHNATISKADLNLPEDKKIILLQGAGINIDRGAEEAVEAMQYIDNAILLIIGSGDVVEILKQKTKSTGIEGRVLFINKMPFAELLKYTHHADIGLTLDKDTNINYRNSLPNKLFDYIHSGIPVLASALPEIKNIYRQYEIGELIESHEPKHIADKINSMLRNDDKMKIWKENTKIAALNLCWEKEEQELLKVYSNFV